MNAAAKIIHESNFFSGNFTDIRIAKGFCLHIILGFVLLINALAIIYVTNMYRITYSQLQIAEQKSYQLQLQKGQLLLEKASLLRPQRMQYLAQEQLGMTLPYQKKIIVLKTS